MDTFWKASHCEHDTMICTLEQMSDPLSEPKAQGAIYLKEKKLKDLACS